MENQKLSSKLEILYMQILCSKTFFININVENNIFVEHETFFFLDSLMKTMFKRLAFI